MTKRSRSSTLAPIVISLAALFFAIGGPGYAQSGVRAVFAKTAANADKVDGLHASRAPRPNRLLPLNAAGKFPSSVLTAGQGPKGDPGPQGAKGDTGPQGPAGSNASLTGVPAGGALTGTYPNPQLAAPQELLPIAFLNGWHDYYLAYNPARYYKDPFGIVHLSGGMAGGTLHVTAFNLPAGYRPSGAAMFLVLSTDSAGGLGNFVPAVLQIYRTGDAHLWNGGSNAFVGLEGITFRATN